MDSISLKNSLNARISQSFGSNDTSTKQTKNDNEQKMQSNSAKISKTLAALAVLGVAGVAGALVFRNKNAKGVKDVVSEINQGMGDVTQNLDDVTKAALTSLDEAKNKSSKIVKRFFLNNGEEVKDAILDKGVVKMPGGSLFNGFVDTVNQKGDKVLLTYKNGYLSESFVNGELFKAYSNITTMPIAAGVKSVQLPPQYGAKVLKMQGNNIENMYTTYHPYHVSSELRIVKTDSEGIFRAIDVKDGKVVAKSVIDGLYPKAQVFNSRGELVSAVANEGKYTIIEDYLSNGSKAVVGGRLDFDVVSSSAARYKIKNPDFIRYYDNSMANPECTLEAIKKPFSVFVRYVQDNNGITRTFEAEIPNQKSGAGKQLLITIKDNDKEYVRLKIDPKDGKYPVSSNVSDDVAAEIKSFMSNIRARMSYFPYTDVRADFLKSLEKIKLF